MRRVLIITYYWPPAGGAGVQRWLKFVKYLRQFGWEPIVYTPANPEMPVRDESLLTDVPNDLTIIRKKITEPYHLYKLFSGRKENINTGFLSEKKPAGWKEKLAVWIRGNFFIPDARRFWIKPSVRFLSHYLKNNPVDVIVSTGPPHSMHLIALGLKEKTRIPWLADFRDPWTDIDYYHDLMLTGCADRQHHHLEYCVLNNADAVVSIGFEMNRQFMQKLNGSETKFHVITNGYDEEDFRIIKPGLTPKFSILHAGTLVRTRNPVGLWRVLSKLINESESFRNALELVLVGKADVSVNESLSGFGLEKYVVRHGYVSHSRTVELLCSAQLLLLILNNTPNAKGILTGKVFEYLASGRPVLCIGPEDGDAARLLANTRSGWTAGYGNEAAIHKIITDCFDRYCKGDLHVSSAGTEQYSRKALTNKLAQVLHSIAH